MSFEKEMAELSQAVHSGVACAQTLSDLEALRVSIFGKKGSLTLLMKNLGQFAPEERKQRGHILNVLKEELGAQIDMRFEDLTYQALQTRLQSETIDCTLPIRPAWQGGIHPISYVWEEIVSIFADLGFFVAEGPHIESEWYNFDALNIPPHHPARQEHDTFYFPVQPDGGRYVLRTHTSPVQIRTMETMKPPLRMLAPGRTFRCDSDQTHTPMFHQVEGLVIDEHSHLGHLKGCLEAFCKAFFEVKKVKMRFRPSYFPFTEPSLEVDIGCAWKDGQVRVGEGDTWLEVLGSGMVHPRVLEASGVDCQRYQGFAFGMGVDRLAMLKYGIADLRAFFDSDLRWLRHYGFSAFQMPSV